MKLSAQEEYGLRCLLRLGREAEGVSMTISELGQREGISAPNVAKLMRVLRRGGYVRSTRGKEGGYTLARAAEDINLGEALAVLGGRLYDPAFCGRHSGVERLCTHMPDCSIRSVWRLVQGAVDQVLGRLSLRDLLCSEQQMSGWKGPNAASLPVVSRPA